MTDTATLLFSDNDYLAMPTASLIHRKVSPSDLFVRLPHDRMVKIAHKGGTIDVERITRLGEKDVQYLYVPKRDFGEIVADLVRGAEGLNRLSNVPVDLKIAKFFNIAESVYAELLHLPIADEAIGRAARLAREISKSMEEKPEFLKMVQTVVSLGDEFTRHSIGTVVMSNILAGQMDWTSPKILEPITHGAFFHDVGLKEIPLELRFKSRIDMDKDEGLLWESHCAKGVHLLSSLPFISADVLRIVQEHHEIPNGQGFPAKLRLDRIFPMAKIVSLGNMLAHDVFDGAAHGHPFSMEAMTQKIEHIYSVMFGADLTRAARRIFKPKP